jgi:hypothetical protein
LLLALPVAELGAVQQHDAARHHAATALGARARAAQNRGTVHVALEQLPDVAHGEDVRVDHNGAALITHQLGRHEAQWREGLQIVIEPEAPGAVTQVVLPVAGAQEIVVLGVDEANSNLSAFREFRVREWRETRAPTICLWLVWMNTQCCMAMFL